MPPAPGGGIDRFLCRLSRLISYPARQACWLVVPVILLVLFSITAGLLRLSNLVTWKTDIFLLGQGVSLNSLLEGQWYLFAIMTMLVVSYAFVTDNHIRVDVISGKLTPRARTAIDVIGDLVLLIPFATMMVVSAMPLLRLAIMTGERSNEDGLADRWLVKGIIPVGFALLAVLAAVRVVRNILRLVAPPPQVTSEGPGAELRTDV